MKTSLIIGIVAVAILLIGGGFFFFRNANANLDSQNPQDLPGASENTQLAAVSPAELAGHNTASDCWVAYDGKVYDITSFLPRHPGSSKVIEPYCGTSAEFQNAFLAKHGTKMVAGLAKQGVLKGNLQ